MKKILNFSMLCCVIFVFNNCTTVRMISKQSVHEREIKRLVQSDLCIEDKVNIFSKILSDVLLESLEFVSDRKSYNHIKNFTIRNKVSLARLMDQIEKEMAPMNALQKLKFVVKLADQPHMKLLKEIIPKVEKKIGGKMKRIMILSKIIKILRA